MKRVWVNYWVDVVTGCAFLVCAVTGVVFLFFPGLLRASGGAATLLGLGSATWHVVHDWSGVVMTAGVGVHLALHLRWLTKMSRKLAGQSPAARRGGVAAPDSTAAAYGAAAAYSEAAAYRAAARSRGATAAAAGDRAAFPAAVAAQSGAPVIARSGSSKRPADRYTPPERRVSRKTFLTAAAAAGGAVLLAGVGVWTRSSSAATTSTSGGAASSQSGLAQSAAGSAGAVAAGSGSACSSDSSAGSSARVAVSSTSCVSCGRCLQVCPYGVFSWDGDGKAAASEPDACRLCGHCVQVCPAAAIRLNG